MRRDVIPPQRKTLPNTTIQEQKPKLLIEKFLKFWNHAISCKANPTISKLRSIWKGTNPDSNQQCKWQIEAPLFDQRMRIEMIIIGYFLVNISLKTTSLQRRSSYNSKPKRKHKRLNNKEAEASTSLSMHEWGTIRNIR
jgi:hypothetical protein